MRSPTNFGITAMSLVLAGPARSRGLLRPHPGGGGLDRVDDVLVAGAPAQVAFDRLADLRFGRILVAGEQVSRRHDHPGRAVSALKPVLFPETLLERMKLA